MAENTKIEWTDATWSPITGCTVLSPGCSGCYAMTLAGGRMQHHWSRKGLTKPGPNGPVWTGEVRFNEAWLDQPLRWRKPRTIFVCAHSDLFHPTVPDEWIDKVFAVMALAPRHVFQVLTKRSERMRSYIENDPRDRINREAGTLMAWDKIGHAEWPLPNVWLGTSIEGPAYWARATYLKQTPAAVRFLSIEPLIEGLGTHVRIVDDMDWVIVGGESGKNARPMHPQWVREIRDQCQTSGVRFFMKQWGEWMPFDDTTELPIGKQTIRCDKYDDRSPMGWWSRVGKKRAGRLLDGRTWDEIPETTT